VGGIGGLWWVLGVTVSLVFGGCGTHGEASAPAAIVAGYEIDEREVGQWVGPFAPTSVRAGADSSRIAAAEALGFLVRTRWLDLEARRRSISVTDADVRRELAKRKAALGGASKVGDYLERSRMTAEQFEYRVKRDVLFRKVMLATVGYGHRVGRAEIARFYSRNRKSFRQPRARDLRVVVTRSKRKAIEARRRVLKGQPWGEVARQFTVDASKRTGGRLSIYASNSIPGLRRTVFAAPAGEVVGPIYVRGLWWVFRVLHEIPPRQQSLEEVAPRIRVSIRSTREQHAVDRLLRLLDRSYGRQTTCFGEHTVPECSMAH
jgi:hypothetical protein